MHKMIQKMTFVIITALTLTACGGSGGGNEGNELSISEPNKEPVTVNVIAPDGFLVVKSLEFSARTNVEAYKSLIGDFNAPELTKTFIDNNVGIVVDNLTVGDAITVHAYDSNAEVYLEKVVGIYSGEKSEFNATLTSVSTAIFEAFDTSVNFSIEDGLANDYNTLSIGGVIEDSAVIELMLDGLTRAEAENSSSGTKDSAVSDIMNSVSGNSDVQSLFKNYFEGSEWKGDTITLDFLSSGVFYQNTAVASPEVGVYEIVDNNGNLEIEFNFEQGLQETSDLSDLRMGTMEIPFLNEALQKQ